MTPGVIRPGGSSSPRSAALASPFRADEAAPPLQPGTQGSAGWVNVALWTCFSSPGMEVAAYLAERAHSVSLVELEHVPFKRFFGERVGRAVMKMTLLSHLAGVGNRAGFACFTYCTD